MLLSREIFIDGIIRTYKLYIPDCPKEKYNFIVFSLHGLGGNAEISIYETSLDKKAEEDCFIAIFPDALPVEIDKEPDFKNNPRKWIAKSFDGHESHDMLFLSSLAKELKKEFNLNNVFFTGFSNGAIMCSYLALRLPELINGIASVCGKLIAAEDDESLKTPTMLIIGEADPIFPVAGGEVKLLWNQTMKVLPLEEMTGHWIEKVKPPREIFSETTKEYSMTSYKNNLTELVVIRVFNHGHIWPGGKSKLTYRVVGNPNRNVSANNLIINFFKKHSK